jgi:hypothetical protein
MLVTLVFFILGSAMGTYFSPDWWISLPSWGAYSLVTEWGLGPALVLNLSLFAAIILGTLVLEKRRGTVYQDKVVVDWRLGPWPLFSGAVGLALLNYAMLAVAGYPWGIVSGFILWGAKWLGALGVDMSQSTYWQNQMGRIDGSVLSDVTSLMNFGILIGAMLGAGLAGRFKPNLSFSGADIVASVIGGLLLGYGARMAFGCNIGALFSGIASGSLHGWLWLVFGFLGNVFGTWLRSGLFLPNPPSR